MTEEKQEQVRYIVCIGKRYYNDKLVDAFYICDAAGKPDKGIVEIRSDNESYSFWPKPNKSMAYASPGSIYRQTSADGTAWGTPNKLGDGRYQDHDIVQMWVIRERSHKAQAERASMQKSEKYAATKAAQSGLDYFRAEYNRAMPARKVAILADVIAYITGRG